MNQSLTTGYMIYIDEIQLNTIDSYMKNREYTMKMY